MGFMRKTHRVLNFVVAVILAGYAQFGQAEDVSLAGMFGANRALLVIDGGKPQVVTVGQMVGRVKVVEIGKDAVTIEIDGKRRNVVIGAPVSIGSSRGTARSVTLVADARGHFIASGTINGYAVSFLVDTGATSITMDRNTALRAGIDLGRGEAGMAGTANGVVPTVQVKLARVTVGDISMTDVDGMVVATQMPGVLLGMSFLNRMEMRRDGGTMVLTQRY